MSKNSEEPVVVALGSSTSSTELNMAEILNLSDWSSAEEEEKEKPKVGCSETAVMTKSEPSDSIATCGSSSAGSEGLSGSSASSGSSGARETASTMSLTDTSEEESETDFEMASYTTPPIPLRRAPSFRQRVKVASGPRFQPTGFSTPVIRQRSLDGPGPKRHRMMGQFPAKKRISLPASTLSLADELERISRESSVTPTPPATPPQDMDAE
jgi:hypothetical protein